MTILNKIENADANTLLPYIGIFYNLRAYRLMLFKYIKKITPYLNTTHARYGTILNINYTVHLIFGIAAYIIGAKTKNDQGIDIYIKNIVLI